MTGSLSRTTWADATCMKTLCNRISSTGIPNFPTIQGVTNINGSTKYYAHEVGVDNVDATGAKTAIPAFIESGDFSLNVDGTNAQLFMSMRRFVPDFKNYSR